MHESIGKTRTLTDSLDPARAAALHATLSRKGDAPVVGDALPAFWHHAYFWDAQPPARLGEDGHPETGTCLIPDLGLPRRMWAGGRLEWHRPLRLGSAAEKTSVVENVSEKKGRSGRLGFVTLRHEIRQDGSLRLSELQELVYREPLSDSHPTPPAPPRTPEFAVRKDTARFDPTLLFRYSALTFNGHRIHYDLDYSREVEGYAGLVVHGPLLAQFLIQLAEEMLGPLSGFSFRATAPLMHFETAEACSDGDGGFWIRGPDGRQCMTAEAAGRVVFEE